MRFHDILNENCSSCCSTCILLTSHQRCLNGSHEEGNIHYYRALYTCSVFLISWRSEELEEGESFLKATVSPVQKRGGSRGVSPSLNEALCCYLPEGGKLLSALWRIPIPPDFPTQQTSSAYSIIWGIKPQVGGISCLQFADCITSCLMTLVLLKGINLF